MRLLVALAVWIFIFVALIAFVRGAGETRSRK